MSQDKSATPQPQQHFNVVVYGSRYCGQSLLIKMLAEPAAVGKDLLVQEPLPTVGVEFSSVSLSNTDLNAQKMRIWDCSGNEAFQSISAHYLRNAHVIMHCVDLSKNVIDQSEIRSMLEYIHKINDNAVIFLLGTKSDKASEATKQKFLNLDLTDLPYVKHKQNISIIDEKSIKLLHEELSKNNDLMKNNITNALIKIKEDILNKSTWKFDGCIGYSRFTYTNDQGNKVHIPRGIRMILDVIDGPGEDREKLTKIQGIASNRARSNNRSSLFSYFFARSDDTKDFYQNIMETIDGFNRIPMNPDMKLK